VGRRGSVLVGDHLPDVGVHLLLHLPHLVGALGLRMLGTRSDAEDAWIRFSRSGTGQAIGGKLRTPTDQPELMTGQISDAGSRPEAGAEPPQRVAGP
jgi:hypothetical protein